MNEHNSGEEAVATDAGANTGTGAEAERGAGGMLREAREAAGIELSALALALKVSIKKLEALENDRYEELPDAVFTRALASSICRTFKLDPGPVLARLPQPGASRLKPQDEDALNAPFRTPDDVAKTPFFDRLSRPMVLGALAVLLGALVVIFFPEIEQRAQEPAETQASSAKPLPESAEYPVDTQESESDPASDETEEKVEAEAASPVVAARPPAATPSIVQSPLKPRPAVQTASAQTTPAPSVAAALAAPPAAPAARPSAPVEEEDDEDPKARFARNGVVVFKMRERGFVQVIDASDTVRISRVLEAGDQVGVVNGPFPLRVTVGRPEVTDVQVRGKPFDLASVIANGQAKFEVN